MEDEKNIQLDEAFDEQGHKTSPHLHGDLKNYLIDIDGTITEDVPNEEPERMAAVVPFPDALETLNRWFDEGHVITFFTSRTEDHRSITAKWLNDNGFKYHGLLMGKPRGGNYHWVDDRAVKATKFNGHFADLVKEHKEIEVFPKKND